MLYIQENLPRCVKNITTNPQVISGTLLIVGNIVNSSLFYPEITWESLEFVASCLPEVTPETMRVITWAATSVTFSGYCVRAYGRLTPSYIASLHESK